MQELSLDGYLTLRWQDPRVKLVLDTPLSPTILLDLETALDQLWLPDLWIESLRQFQTHRNVKDQATIQMDKNSYFTYWQR